MAINPTKQYAGAIRDQQRFLSNLSNSQKKNPVNSGEEVRGNETAALAGASNARIRANFALTETLEEQKARKGISSIAEA